MRFLLLMSCAAVCSAADFAITLGEAEVGHATLPAEWRAVPSQGCTVIIPPGRHPHVELIPVADGVDVAKAEADIATLVVNMVTKFAPDKRSEMTVAGAPAVRLDGPGLEADDGDDSIAQATIFTFKGHTWILTAHAEGPSVAENQEKIDGLLASLKD
jgi:hypothetical protein